MSVSRRGGAVFFLGFLAVLNAAAWSWGATATVSKGTLSTSSGASILDSDVATWLGGINGSAKQLIVLTECFGGNAATAFTGTNQAVASATSVGQKAVYGGYDNGAAGAVKPQAGKTGQDVHNAGVGTKAASETPTTGGGLPLNQFPMDPVGQNNVESRHVIVYAGSPNNVDVQQRNTISANNPNNGTTNTVTTVGDSGATGGWDQPGSAAGLKAAIDAAKTKINNATNPGREQLILFITDHGDTHDTQTRTVNIPATSTGTVTDHDPANGNATQNGLRSFTSSPSSGFSYVDPAAINDNSVQSFFDVFINLGPGSGNNSNTPIPSSSLNTTIQPNLWTMGVVPSSGPPTTLFNPVLLPYDIDGDGIIGDTSGEGALMEFPVPGPFMASSFFDVFVELDLGNGTAMPWNVSNPEQSTGEIAPSPEPATFGLLATFAVGLGLRRHRKT